MITVRRKFVKVEIDFSRPAIGSCLGAFASTFPVAFLEPHLNKHNPFCIHGKLKEHSLKAQGNQAEFLKSFNRNMDDFELVLIANCLGRRDVEARV